MEAVDIIRAAIPNASEAVVDFVMWSRTPFPIGAVSPKDLYQAAARLRRASANGIRLCDHCDNQVVGGEKSWMCQRCQDVLAKYR